MLTPLTDALTLSLQRDSKDQSESVGELSKLGYSNEESLRGLS